MGREMAMLIIPPALREAHRKGLAKYLATGEGPVIGRRIEIRAVRADGLEFPVELTITPVPLAGPPSFTGTIRDITDREAAEKERLRLLEAEKEAREEAEAANSTKDIFLATVSHELRTPLNAILGWTQLARSGMSGPEDVSMALETVERNARSMAQLVEEVLDVSRIVTGKMRLDVRPVQMAPVVEAALEAVQPAADAKGIRLHPVLNPHAGAIMGDAGRLQQVVWNLLSNAIKFTPKGGRVQITLERINSHIELIVTDTGEGIPAEFLAHLFERFTQADSSSARSHQGLGLGLAIVRHLVELHGGTIDAASEGVGKGATFVVNIPVAAAYAARQEPARIHSSASGDGNGAADPLTSRIALKGVRVLVVDDEPDAQLLLRTILEGAGVKVDTAASADEAMEMLKQRWPDVLISDIGMPGEDGYRFIQRVRALETEKKMGMLPAAAVTAFARTEDRRQALLAGFQLHLAKPVEAAELLAVVASLANRSVPLDSAGP
jgi:signal transduction histidine kinase/ActR/RegA family two-component response regulator